MKVVRRDEAGSRGICQNPELASSLEKNFAPTSCVSVCSTAGSSERTCCVW